MKIVVASDSTVTPNMVRGIFRETESVDAEIIAVKQPAELDGHISGQAVVLVDWDLKPSVGVAFVQAVKQAAPDTPVILLTSKAKATSALDGMKAGAEDMLHKPVSRSQLLKAVGEGLKGAGSERPKINVEYINPFVESTRNVFTSMCRMEVERKRLFLKDDYRMFGDISGVMGLSGEASGSVVISLPTRLACVAVGRMIGQEPAADLDEDVSDAVGEIINMISGQAKAMLAKSAYRFTISLPSVVSGAGHEITHKKGTPNIVLMFEADGQPFAIQVCLQASSST